MSYSEIYKFGKNGEASFLGEVKNSWCGAAMVWRILENKYLPPLPKPDWMNETDYKEHGYSRTSPSFDVNSMKPIRNLWKDGSVSRIDKIVLRTTFDNIVVMCENLKKVINSFNEFDNNTSLQEQAKILNDALLDELTIGVAWNQTSVNNNTG